MADQTARRMSIPLVIGIVFVPYVFAWLLLQRGYSSIARRVAFGWLAVVGVCILLNPSGPGSQPRVDAAPASARFDAAPASSVPGSKHAQEDVDPAEERQRNKAILAEVQQRLERNRERLKGHYPNKAAIQRGSNDLVNVTAIAVSRGMSKAKEDQQQAAEAKALSIQVAEQIRLMYASSMEEGFVKNGIDSRISAVGKGKVRLVISYALMSQPMVYKFQNEHQLPVQARALGFKQIQYTNGFESELGQTWTVDL